MTPVQQFCLLLGIAAAFQVWMMIFRPEQYEREIERRDRNIKAGANAATAIAKFFLTKR
jgi:hypothetical protein